MWCIFVLWAFVFAWHKEYSGREVFRFDVGASRLGRASRRMGLAATAPHRASFSIPALRDNRSLELSRFRFAEWIAVTLFSVVFGPLFLVFAPLAFLSSRL